jgi:hypothetical protein
MMGEYKSAEDRKWLLAERLYGTLENLDPMSSPRWADLSIAERVYYFATVETFLSDNSSQILAALGYDDLVERSAPVSKQTNLES